MSVHAVELDHTVPTVGWVLTEQPRPGKLDAEAVLPLLREHNVHPRVLREFKSGSPITLPDGTGPPRRGRTRRPTNYQPLRPAGA